MRTYSFPPLGEDHPDDEDDDEYEIDEWPEEDDDDEYEIDEWPQKD